MKSKVKAITHSEISSRGGRAAASRMTDEARSERARAAAEARWGAKRAEAEKRPRVAK